MRWLALLLAFHSSVAPAPRNLVTWHSGCPVPVSQLRLVTVTYWGFDSRAHTGRLVVNRAAVRPVVRAFARVGWGSGGYWRSLKDYQHFSWNSR